MINTTLLNLRAAEKDTIDWAVFKLLSPVHEGASIDWDVFNLLSPSNEADETNTAVSSAYPSWGGALQANKAPLRQTRTPS